MLKYILGGIVAIVAIFAVVVTFQPADFRVERTAQIAAPAPEVFAQVNDFRTWTKWSPFERDPAMKKSFDGPPTGTGASYAWSGNDEVGEGRATIVESRPNDLVRIKLEFVRPFAATNTAEFTFRQAGNGTAVTWALIGERNFIAKAICMFMDMDKMVGGDFEKGLAQLGAAVQAARS
jgi:uncharacterized protein YndB with AHSA1/START domain